MASFAKSSEYVATVGEQSYADGFRSLEVYKYGQFIDHDRIFPSASEHTSPFASATDRRNFSWPLTLAQTLLKACNDRKCWMYHDFSMYTGAS